MLPPYGRSQIRKYLRLRGKRQVDLALHLEVTEGYISRVCRDEEFLSVLNMKRTARFLGVTMDDLIKWDQSLFKPLS